jgi:cytochrome c oxidase subunit II
MTCSAFIPSLALALQQQADGSFWLPPRNSTTAAGTDWMFYLIYWISLFFFVLIVGLMVYFAIRYRRRPGRLEAEAAPHHSTILEIVWTVIPIGLVILIFWGGFTAFLNLTTPPSNSFDIYVTGQKWKWLFTYPNGYVAEELHVPLDSPVRLVMTSEDIIHSFYIPDFRVKKDVVPGRYSNLWFEATKTGEFNIFCAEYCGTGHSDMITKVIVHDPADFAKWLEQAASFVDTMPPADAGEYLFKKYGCNQCHSTDGTANTGPTFLNGFGGEHLMNDGTTVVMDENYIQESVLNPQAKIRDGFQGVMPTFQGKIKEEEIRYIIAFLKSLSDKVSQQEKDLLKQAPAEKTSADRTDADAGAADGTASEDNPSGGDAAAPAQPSADGTS